MSAAARWAFGPSGATCCATAPGGDDHQGRAGDDPAHTRHRRHRPAVQGGAHGAAAQRPRPQRSLISPPGTIPCDANNRVCRRKLLTYNEFPNAGVQVQPGWARAGLTGPDSPPRASWCGAEEFREHQFEKTARRLTLDGGNGPKGSGTERQPCGQDRTGVRGWTWTPALGNSL